MKFSDGDDKAFNRDLVHLLVTFYLHYIARIIKVMYHKLEF